LDPPIIAGFPAAFHIVDILSGGVFAPIVVIVSGGIITPIVVLAAWVLEQISLA